MTFFVDHSDHVPPFLRLSTMILLMYFKSTKVAENAGMDSN